MNFATGADRIHGTNGLCSKSVIPPYSESEITSILFENVRIFNGTSEQLSAPSNVLVVGNKIQKISTASISVSTGTSVTQINGKGRVLMPRLIDNHTHLFMETSAIEDLVSPNIPFEAVFRKAQTNATEMLLRGFTSARDMAGPVFELKKRIDRGDVVGPRIWPSGAMISQTSGHGDFRSLDELPRTPSTPFSRAEVFGFSSDR